MKQYPGGTILPKQFKIISVKIGPYNWIDQSEFRQIAPVLKLYCKQLFMK